MASGRSRAMLADYFHPSLPGRQALDNVLEVT
jgi:hypothetical protein